jgi:hypothetical protein
MPDYVERQRGLNRGCQIESRRRQMTVLNRIKNFVAAFVQPVEAGYAPDSIAYHSRPDERELRFSRSDVLRRYY